MAGRKFRISPIEDEVSFRQLQKKHDHFIKFGNFVVFPTHNNHSAGTQYVKRRPKFKGYLPQTKSEVLKHNVGSHANALVYPEREQPEVLDDVPQYIYPANPKKHHRFDTASGILKNVNRKGTFPIKGQDLKTEREQPEAFDEVPQYIYPTKPKKHHSFHTASEILKTVKRKRTFPIKGQDLKTERAVVDTLVADYLCNHHYGYMIPIYEGTGVQTCPCCTNRNRENVRHALGLTPDPSNTAQHLDNKTLVKPRTNQGSNITINVYPLGTHQKQQKPIIKMDPSFRLSDTETRMKWESSTTFEEPDFYKKAITRSYPDSSSYDDKPMYHSIPKTGPTMFRSFPSDHNELNKTNFPYIVYNIDSNELYGTVDESVVRTNSNPAYVTDRITSADKKYNYSMSHLRKFTNK
jgi:hypothetical protein